MSYIEKTLTGSEKLLYQTTLHWIIFAWPFFSSIAIAAFLVSRHPYQINLMFQIGGLLFTLYLWLSAAIQYLTSEFALTNYRVVMKIGFIRVYTFEILLNRVESTQVRQTVVGRILNYGSVVVTGTGGSPDPFAWIRDPFTFRKKIQEQVELFRQPS